jgi:hypothetical protein
MYGMDGDIRRHTLLLEDIQRHTNIIGKLFMLFYTNSLFKKNTIRVK